MSQGTMATLGTIMRAMREIQILAAAESLPDAAPADVSHHVKNGRDDDTSRANTITQLPNQHATHLLLVKQDSTPLLLVSKHYLKL
jgi:hypothetical protein